MSPEIQILLISLVAWVWFTQVIILHLDKKAQAREIRLMREEIEKLEHELWLKKQELYFMRPVPQMVDRTAEDESRNQSLKHLREMYQQLDNSRTDTPPF